MGAALSMMGMGFHSLESVIREQFGKKGESVAEENVAVARAGYDYATQNFKPFANRCP
jgi:2-oxoglutarate ferredoxin oxidoreductase subunit alpha